MQDPLAEFRERLHPPIKNRILADAVAALANGQSEVAESLVGNYLRKKPRDPDALNIMAEIARRSQRFEEAETWLEQCVEASPKSIGFRFNYAVVLRHLQKQDQALAQIDQLLHADAFNPLFRDQKAGLLALSGKHAEALVWRRELIQDFPLWPEGWLHFGGALRDLGEQAECVAAYHRALELDPTLTAAYSRLAALKVYPFTAADIAEMEKQLTQAGLSSDARADVHHALGRAYGDARNYTKSFENYAKGNALRRISVGFDTERIAAHRRACEELFSEAFFLERAGWGCPSSEPIFIVGLPRSGSTLIEQILCSHSAIEGLGELADLDSALVAPLAKFHDEFPLQEFAAGRAVEKSAVVPAYARLMHNFTDSDFRAIGEDYLSITRPRRIGGRPLFTDKTLRNFLYIGLIHLVLPNAKIIDTRRHPLDCGWSCFKSQFRGSHFSLKLSDIGNDYVNYVRLMAHFDHVLPGRVHRVIHENLLTDPETEIRSLFEYIELPFENRCLRFHENQRAVITQSSEQVRTPMNKDGMRQWLPYEPWLAPLKNALGSVLDCYPHVPDDGDESELHL